MNLKPLPLTYKRILFSLVFIVFLTIGNAATFHVNGSIGSDLFDGLTPTSPFKTIQKAADTVSAGDEVVIYAGIYYEKPRITTLGTPAAPIVFRADEIGKNRVIISGANPAYRRNSNWILEDSATGLYSITFSGGQPKRILYDGIDLYPYGSIEGLNSFTTILPAKGPKHGYFFDTDASKLYVRLHASGRYGSTDPRQHDIAIAPSTFTTAFAITQVGEGHIVIDGITFEAPGQNAIATSASHVTIRRCWFVGSPYAVRGIDNAATDVFDSPSNIIIEFCDYSEGDAYGDVMDLIAEAALSNTTSGMWDIVWHRKTAGRYGLPSSVINYETGLTVYMGADWVIRNNYIHDTFEGISVDGMSRSSGAKIHDNIFARICDNAIETENHAANLYIYRNHFIDVAEPFSWQPSDGLPWPGPIYFYQNVITNTEVNANAWKYAWPSERGVFKIGISLSNWNDGKSADVPKSPLYATEPGLFFFNNTIDFPGGRLFTILGDRSVPINNVYFFSNILSVDYLESRETDKELIDGFFTFYSNITVLAASDNISSALLASGYEGLTFPSISDIGWSDRSSGNYALLSDSPALNRYFYFPDVPEKFADAGALQNSAAWSQPNVGPLAGNEYQASTATPLAPSTPAAFVSSASQITISWSDDATNEGGFQIERSTNGIDFFLIATAPQNGCNFADFGLFSSTTYYYRIRAYNDAGFSPYSTVVSATTQSGLPVVPVRLSAIAGDGQVELTWTPSSGATSYNVKRSSSKSGSYVLIAENITATSYTDISADNGITFYYVVSASNTFGESRDSQHSVATPETTQPPPPSESLAAAVSNRQVTLLWAASPGAATYTIKRATASDGPYEDIATGVATTSYLDKALTNGTRYYYHVHAVNIYGEGVSSGIISATPQNVAGTITVDNADATGVTITGSWTATSSTGGYYGSNYIHDNNTGSSGGKSVRFSPVLAPGTYSVYLRWTAGSNRANNVAVEVTHADGKTSSSINQKLNGGTWWLLGTFSFNSEATGSVLISNDGANGYVMADAVQFVPNSTLPSVPQGLIASADEAKIMLSWDASTNASSYQIMRATASQGPYVAIATDVSSTQFEDMEVSSGITYHYVVSASSYLGESHGSQKVSATVPLMAMRDNLVPVIIEQPLANQTASDGGNASIAAMVLGSPAPIIAWQVSSNGTNWTTISPTDSTGLYSISADGSILTIINANASMSGYRFRYIATNDSGSATSTATNLNITDAIFAQPAGLVFDSTGVLYVADTGLHTVQRISASGTSHILAGIPGIAGSTNATGTATQFDSPTALHIFAGALLVADSGNSIIRKLDVITADVTDYIGPLAGLLKATGITSGDDGVLVADTKNHVIRHVTSTDDAIVLAGALGESGFVDGFGAEARFSSPRAIAYDTDGRYFIADTGNNAVRVLSKNGTSWEVSTLASVDDGLNAPRGIVVSGSGADMMIYVADTGNSLISQITPDGTVTPIAGYTGIDEISGVISLKDGSGAGAWFNKPEALAIGPDQNLYVADTGNGVIRKITFNELDEAVVSTLTISGNPSAAAQPASELKGSHESGGGMLSIWFWSGVALLGGMRFALRLVSFVRR